MKFSRERPARAKRLVRNVLLARLIYVQFLQKWIGPSLVVILITFGVVSARKLFSSNSDLTTPARKTSAAQTETMEFRAYPPDATYERLMGSHAWRIFATGEIDQAAAQRLAALIANSNIPMASTLYLHSPGGSLVGGMMLGRVIREHKLATYVGQFDPARKYVSAEPGFCYSACATAFLGGEFRYWTDGSVYGVHRFFWKSHSDSDADDAQIVSSAVVEYIRSMGVDTKIFALASQAGASEVITPSHDVLLALNVVNDGRKPARWTIESMAQGIYLKGEQETDNGTNKFMLACIASEPTMFLYAIFDAGMNAGEVLTFPVNWLFLDQYPVRMDNQLVKKENVNGKINLVYQLNTNLVTAISRAKRVGVGLQAGVGGAVFAGFDSMPFEQGAAKLSGFSTVCARGRS
jgi:hypothetical protein